jgi:hypothetical protein
MAEMRFEAVVEDGVIRLMEQIHLPDKTRVFVTVPAEGSRPLHFPSPRLAHPEQASQFSMEVIEDGPNAGIR